MTKSEALALVGLSITQLADRLGITHSAVSQWPEDQIPLARQYQIIDLANNKEPIKSQTLTAQVAS